MTINDCAACSALHRELRFTRELFLYLRSGRRGVESLRVLERRIMETDRSLWDHEREEHAGAPLRSTAGPGPEPSRARGAGPFLGLDKSL
jgi:hypothetical protein